MRSPGSEREAKREEEERRGDERERAGPKVHAGSSSLLHLSAIDCLPAERQLKAPPEMSLSVPHFADRDTEPPEDRSLTRVSQLLCRSCLPSRASPRGQEPSRCSINVCETKVNWDESTKLRSPLWRRNSIEKARSNNRCSKSAPLESG